MDPVRDKNLESSGPPSAGVSNGMDFFNRHRVWAISFAFAMLCVGGYQALFSAPRDFPTGSIVTIAKGSSAPAAAQTLAAAHVIAHPLVLELVLRFTRQSGNVHAGAYLFESRQNLFSVAERLVTGAYGFPPVRLTFVEGVTVREAAAQIAEAFPAISAEAFLKEARPYEGYLFPDTYFFSMSADVTSVVKAMRDNFNAKLAPLSADISASGHSLTDIVTMASLVEKEARTSAVRHVVAGILFNRLRLGMPLQVDAVFGYIFNRDTFSPSYADLKVDSPYNTYTHKGLPPGAINNPGLDALDAALHPTKTEYLYYLTDKEGVMHYATTYAGHQANQRKYLP
ncbi:MAG: endolytic transglycosylase MltG [Candidatus Pacebacteria bacterium]|nr:endolytic transglycosylase MltG [Candidatus Paceibacterota bacterium]